MLLDFVMIHEASETTQTRAEHLSIKVAVLQDKVGLKIIWEIISLVHCITSNTYFNPKMFCI